MLFTGFTIGFSGAMIPGPLTLFTASEVLKSDKLAGFKIILGHIAIELVIVALIFLGFHNLFTFPGFLSGVSVVGGLALIAMGVLLLFSSGKMKMPSIKADAKFNRGLIAGGIFFSIASPGFIVWWATIGFSTVIKAALLGMIGVSVLLLGHWLADLLWYGLFSYALDRGKAYLCASAYRRVIIFFSFLLIVLGFAFLILKRS